MTDDVQMIHQAISLAQEGKLSQAEKILRPLVGDKQMGEAPELACGVLFKIKSSDYHVTHRYGTILFNNNKIKEAAQVFQHALRLNQTSSASLNNLSNCLIRLGDLKGAEIALEKALLYTTENIEKKQIIPNLISVKRKRGKLDDVSALMEKYQQNSKNDRVLLSIEASMALNKGEVQRAEYLYDRMIENDAEDALAWYLKSRLYAGKPDQSIFISCAQKAYDLYHRGSKTLEISVEDIDKLSVELDMARQNANLVEYMYKFETLDLMYKHHADVHLYQPEKGTLEFQVLDIHNVSIYPDTWEIFKEDKTYWNLTFYRAPNSSKCYRHTHGGMCLIHEKIPYKVISEPMLFLGGCQSYYHWWLDDFPRFMILESYPELKDLPVLMNTELADYQKESLKKIGFDFDRLVPIESQVMLNCAQLYVPHFLNRPMLETNIPNWRKTAFTKNGIEWTRKKMGVLENKISDAPKKRIFISRKGADFRTCINEDEVFELVREKGFEIIQNEDLSFQDQLGLYQQAEIVMGVHGAGFTNMLFAPAGAKVIEMIGGHSLPDFYKDIAKFLKQEHIELSGEFVYALTSLDESFWHFEVGVEDVKNMLEALDT